MSMSEFVCTYVWPRKECDCGGIHIFFVGGGRQWSSKIKRIKTRRVWGLWPPEARAV